jgi:hypothetical protein
MRQIRVLIPENEPTSTGAGNLHGRGHYTNVV